MPAMPRISRGFLRTDAESLAAGLLGQRLVRVLPGGERLSGIIVETEAYVGVIDRASHAFAGRRTARNESMYAQAGTAYVYFTYGMHWCFNIVCGRVDEPLAVLVRALEPVEGIERMRERRTRPGVDPPGDTALCSGPARLCQALAIDRSFNGIDLTRDARLFLARANGVRPTESDVACSARIGVGGAGEWADAPLRFYLRENPHVSRGGPVAGGRARAERATVSAPARRPSGRGRAKR